jgi:hypothetical protein
MRCPTRIRVVLCDLGPRAQPPRIPDYSQSRQANLACLLTKINIIRASWGKPMTVTSGLRTPEDQAIYKKNRG